MLGIGLHTYGFMSKAFPWLMSFVVLQVLLALLTRLPASRWRSFRHAERRVLTAAGFDAPV